MLAGFELIDRGRRVLEDPASSPDERAAADELVWEGNLRLLEHEQRALVQPHFDRLSCRFARLASMGSATSLRGQRAAPRAALLHLVLPLLGPRRGQGTGEREGLAADHRRSTTGGAGWSPASSRASADSIAHAALLELSLRRIREESHYYEVNPCVLRQ